MFEIVFLGTSASAPSIHRGLSAQVVMHNEHRFLIDCGEGTQRQILQSGIGFKRLERVLITHGHLDHILGLAGLVSTFTRWETAERLEIWAGRWALQRIQTLLNEIVLKGARLPFPLSFHEIKPGQIFADKTFTVTAFPVSHRGADSFGFLFEERTRRPFLVDKAEALGVPAGPVRRTLASGQAITLADGRTVTPDEVLGEVERGIKFVHVGDCGDTRDLVKIAQGADALVIESTYLSEESEMAHDFGHLTATQAATLARDAGVGQLLLTHISRRHRERDVLEEAQKTFPKTFVARDFDHFRILRGETLKVIDA